MNDKANPKQAFGDKKVPLHLNPPIALAHMATAMREGAFKYGAWNFREDKVEMMTYIGAILRHTAALLEGEWFDTAGDVVHPKTGEVLDAPVKSHVAGILGSAAIIADATSHGMMIDNTPKGVHGKFSTLLENMELGASDPRDPLGEYTEDAMVKRWREAGAMTAVLEDYASDDLGGEEADQLIEMWRVAKKKMEE